MSKKGIWLNIYLDKKKDKKKFANRDRSFILRMPDGNDYWINKKCVFVNDKYISVGINTLWDYKNTNDYEDSFLLNLKGYDLLVRFVFNWKHMGHTKIDKIKEKMVDAGYDEGKVKNSETLRELIYIIEGEFKHDELESVKKILTIEEEGV